MLGSVGRWWLGAALVLATCGRTPLPPQPGRGPPATDGALHSVSRPGWITFNQHDIEDLWLAAHAFDAAEEALVREADRTAAAYWEGHGPPSISAVRFEDPRSVFDYLFQSLPPLAVVYPTATYYGYRFTLGRHEVTGNLRFVDADSGILHIGYVDQRDRSRVHHATLGAAEGVEVQRLAEGRYRVRHHDREVEFQLGQRALGCEGPPLLLAEETCLSGVLDESGIPLKLVYDASRAAFSFVLNEAIPRVAPLVPIEGTRGRYLLDRRTQFVFLADGRAHRTLLVAVAARNVDENNDFDGPFDQVPPGLVLQDKLEAAYPYLRWDPIDRHGRFLQREGQRVAISPYLAYRSLDAAIAELRRREQGAALPGARWAALTYEPKRDFHRTLAASEREAVASPTASSLAVDLASPQQGSTAH
jgi:hypothetical protein